MMRLTAVEQRNGETGADPTSRSHARIRSLRPTALATRTQVAVCSPSASMNTKAFTLMRVLVGSERVVTEPAGVHRGGGEGIARSNDRPPMPPRRVRLCDRP